MSWPFLGRISTNILIANLSISKWRLLLVSSECEENGAMDEVIRLMDHECEPKPLKTHLDEVVTAQVKHLDTSLILLA